LSLQHACRQYNTRHLSFNSGGGVGEGGGSGSPAGMQVHQQFAQQRTSNSSVQVLASLQLDATLASITHEARHDGALAERLAHWKATFRERGWQLLGRQLPTAFVFLEYWSERQICAYSDTERVTM
jgi:hypothetical protein